MKTRALQKNTFSCSLLICLIVLTLILTAIQPRVANAQAGGLLGGAAGCAAGYFIQKLVGQLDLFASLLNVPTAPTTLNAKEGILDCVAFVMANVFLDVITKSIVDWAQSGFDGNPAFVENLEEYAEQSGESAFQNYWNTINWDRLCSPFRAQIQIALLSTRSFQDRVSCTLDEVVGNAEDVADFIAGDFDKGGWAAWFELTQNPANNPYGAYLLTQGAFSQVVEEKVSNEKNLLDMGRGFFSKKQCSQYLICNTEGPTQPQQDPDQVGPPAPGSSLCPSGDKEIVPAESNPDPSRIISCYKEDVVTPGDIVEDRINEAIDVGGRRLEMADEINEIINALIQALITEVLEDDEGLRGVNTDRLQSGEDYTPPSALCDEFPDLEGCDGSGVPPPPPGDGSNITCDSPEYLISSGGQSAAEAVIVEEEGTFFTATETEPRYIIPIPVPSGTTFGKASVELDVTIGPWFVETDPFHAVPRKLHNLFWLHRGSLSDLSFRPFDWAENVIGFHSIIGPGEFNSYRIRAGWSLNRDVNGPCLAQKNSDRYEYQVGETYRFTYTYDTTTGVISGSAAIAETGEIVATFEDRGDTANIIQSNHPTSSRGGSGFFIIFGNGLDETGPEAPTLGWQYANLTVTFEP